MIDDNNVFKIEIIYLHFANNWAGRCKTRAGAPPARRDSTSPIHP